ncbi:MAG TPA: NrsF family protein [Polyangia bacterium]|nr:NrsF family protein [Polyangia bacterium]HWE27332.1 NrsF family protein [Polyangia bacterium]
MTPGDELPTPPPPSPALRAIVSGVQPVRTRRPLRMFALLVGVSAVYLALWLTRFHHRRDLGYLPFTWWLFLGVAWIGGFVMPLAMAVVPRRGAVLPDGARASTATFAVAAVLLVLAFAFTPAAPPHTYIPQGAHDSMAMIRHCMTVGLAFAIGPLAIGLVFLRRLLIVGGGRLMAAVGAASGALAGLLLHIICPMGGALHVGFGHGGVVVIAGLLGGAIGYFVGKR